MGEHMSELMQVNSIDKKIAGQVRKLRIQNDLSNVSIALKLGVTVEAYELMEGGAQRFRAAHLFALSRLLGTPIGRFFETVKRA
jgi:transcriptional regulator with XRE-family HTH domain